MIVNVDIESRAEADLKKVGAAGYARHPATEITIVQVSVDGGPVWGWHVGEPNINRRELENLLNKKATFRAWNVGFEQPMLRECWGIDIPTEQWEDTMVLSYQCGYPGSLAGASEALGLGEHAKDRSGKRLIGKFSKRGRVTKNKPDGWSNHLTDPGDWLKFVQYCRQDVIAEQAAHAKLLAATVPDFERAYWELDQRINARGMPIDMDLVHNARVLSERALGSLTARTADITGLDNPNSGSQLLPWLQRHGYRGESLTKANVASELERLQDA